MPPAAALKAPKEDNPDAPGLLCVIVWAVIAFAVTLLAEEMVRLLRGVPPTGLLKVRLPAPAATVSARVFAVSPLTADENKILPPPELMEQVDPRVTIPLKVISLAAVMFAARDTAPAPDWLNLPPPVSVKFAPETTVANPELLIVTPPPADVLTGLLKV